MPDSFRGRRGETYVWELRFRLARLARARKPDASILSPILVAGKLTLWQTLLLLYRQRGSKWIPNTAGWLVVICHTHQSSTFGMSFSSGSSQTCQISLCNRSDFHVRVKSPIHWTYCRQDRVRHSSAQPIRPQRRRLDESVHSLNILGTWSDQIDSKRRFSTRTLSAQLTLQRTLHWGHWLSQRK
jgi:hypothetical protein